ncbi:hypothetical protein AQ490_05665 [Wenjunlia vitaminophila]|uniref:Uncharacterized protein n=1 Tax=Wenjunlia vitaminophila TaxID=76728 RepID=A0A0T6LP13_WENVI|nr:hypothetical protein AQ490_05665 [Wenjunlia vitaminophila]
MQALHFRRGRRVCGVDQFFDESGNGGPDAHVLTTQTALFQGADVRADRFQGTRRNVVTGGEEGIGDGVAQRLHQLLELVLPELFHVRLAREVRDGNPQGTGTCRGHGGGGGHVPGFDLR